MLYEYHGPAVRQSPDTHRLVAPEGCSFVQAMAMHLRALMVVIGLVHANHSDSMHWSMLTIDRTMNHYLDTIFLSNVPCIQQILPMGLTVHCQSFHPRGHAWTYWH